ncbi:MAG: response regulator [Candidatus Riflebacteria bacterium]|nr:response regulator [Candidatus Riflebacteria bacterium]
MKKRILLVEDSKTQAYAVRAALLAAGYDVELATSGEAAIESIKKSRPDLMVLDVGLPQMSGLEVCRALRLDAEAHALPILMFTDKEDSPAEILGLQHGADDYVGKSEPMETLLTRIQRMLERVEIYQRVSLQEKLDLLRDASNIVSHGINNPLQVIQMSLEILERQPMPEELCQRALANLRRYFNRIAKLVKNIEMVSRIASETFVERKVLFDLRKALEDAEVSAKENVDWRL